MTNLIDAAKSGNKRATLIALRDKLAETIQNCDSGRDMASNSKRLMEVMAEIEALPDETQKKVNEDNMYNNNDGNNNDMNGTPGSDLEDAGRNLMDSIKETGDAIRDGVDNLGNGNNRTNP